MNIRSFKTVAALSAIFIVCAAAALSAHAAVRDIRAAVASFDRAGAIARWVLTGDRTLRPRALALREGRVQTAPPAPSAPGAPQAPAPPSASSPANPAPEAGPAAPASATAPRNATRPTRASAAAPQAPAHPAAPSSPEAPPSPDIRDFQPDHVEFHGNRPIVRINQNYVVPAGETVDEVVLIAGSLQVEGRVRGDVVVILGKATVGSAGVIDGDLVNVGGGVDVVPGGAVHGDLLTIAGALGASASFAPGGEQVVIGSTEMGDRVRAFVPWLTGGLLLGRVIVPSLAWTWVVLGISFFVALVIGLVFEHPVRTSAAAIAAKPVTSFLTGLLILILVAPVSALLAISIVGIVALPFLLFALMAATVIGKIAVTRWLGSSFVRERDPESRGEFVRSFVIGFLLLTVAYAIPIVGITTWAMVSVLGLGGAVSTMFRALRRENPAPPRPPAPVVPPPAPSAGPTDPRAPGDQPGHAPGVAPVPTLPLMAEPSTSASAFGDQGGTTPAGYPAASTAVPYPSLSAPAIAASPADTSTLLALPRARLSQRLAAGLMDGFLIFIVYQFFDPRQREFFWYLTFLTMYNVGFWTWRGTTIGGLICRMRVVRTDGRPLSWEDSAVRGLSSVFSLLALGIGFLWMQLADNRERQAWHDLIAGTVVVRVPHSAPLR